MYRSSLSTAMNASAAIVLEDFFKALMSKNLSEKMANLVIKITVIITGCLCVCLVHIVEKMGTVLQFTMTVSTIAGGPSLGITTMGLLIPWVNSKVNYVKNRRFHLPLRRFSGRINWRNIRINLHVLAII